MAQKEADDYLVNGGDPGTGLVDLTLNWPTGRDVTGRNQDVTTWQAPTESSPGNYYYEDPETDEIIHVDEDGDPLPPVRNPDDHSVPPDPAAPSVGNFKVNTGTLFECEGKILTDVKQQIIDFEAFKNARLEREPWIFFTGNAKDIEDHIVHGTSSHWDHPNYGDRNTKVKDPHPEKTAEITQSQNALIQNIGGAIQLLSLYISKINDAAQTYASADRKSWVE